MELMLEVLNPKPVKEPLKEPAVWGCANPTLRRSGSERPSYWVRMRQDAACEVECNCKLSSIY